MKVEVNDLSPVKKSMTIEVAPDVIESETRKVLEGYARSARIPGFRQGKAPRELIRKRFAKEVEEDVRDRVVSRSYREATEERGLRPLGDPVLDKLDYREGEPLTFTTTFEVLPQFELKDHKGVEVLRPKVAVEPGDVDKALEELREARIQLVSDESPATTGSVVVADVEGQPEEGEPFRRERMFIEVGEANNLPAFNEKLEGVRAGDTPEFTVDYPAEYPRKELAGKPVVYRLNIHEVKRKQLPELDDEFAKDLGDFENLEALKTRVHDDLKARREAEVERDVRNRVLEKVLLANPIVLPDVLVDEEIRHRLEGIARNLLMQGVDIENAEIDWKEIRQKQEEAARKSVHARLVLDTVGRMEGVEVTREEIDERIRHDARHLQEKPEKLRKQLEKGGGLQALKSQLVREKSLDLLTSVANIRHEE